MAPGIDAIKKSFRGEVLENNSVEFMKICPPNTLSFQKYCCHDFSEASIPSERSFTYVLLTSIRDFHSLSKRSEKALSSVSTRGVIILSDNFLPSSVSRTALFFLFSSAVSRRTMPLLSSHLIAEFTV